MKTILTFILMALVSSCAYTYDEYKKQFPMDSILPVLSERRSWSINEVKIPIEHPDLAFEFWDASSIPYEAEIWDKNQNDYNVPMIRINSTDQLYEITEEEFVKLYEKYKEASNQRVDPTREGAQSVVPEV